MHILAESTAENKIPGCHPAGVPRGVTGHRGDSAGGSASVAEWNRTRGGSARARTYFGSRAPCGPCGNGPGAGPGPRRERMSAKNRPPDSESDSLSTGLDRGRERGNRGEEENPRSRELCRDISRVSIVSENRKNWEISGNLMLSAKMTET